MIRQLPQQSVTGPAAGDFTGCRLRTGVHEVGTLNVGTVMEAGTSPPPMITALSSRSEQRLSADGQMEGVVERAAGIAVLPRRPGTTRYCSKQSAALHLHSSALPYHSDHLGDMTDVTGVTAGFQAECGQLTDH